ncbi:hypothetical protein CH292_27405 [Rhodococcus sp. 14-2470-1a]|nr:hypothetical protein CH292_27405 [Rhodococcus sp. 14-2470-1a]
MPETLFPDCVLPGCRQPVAEHGQPCAGCIEAFGPALQQTSAPALTAEQADQRDRPVRRVQAVRRRMIERPAR